MTSTNQGFGVFAWRGDNRYRIGDAVKTYQREGAAQKYADKLNDDPKTAVFTTCGYVVRTLAYCLSGSTVTR